MTEREAAEGDGKRTGAGEEGGKEEEEEGRRGAEIGHGEAQTAE